MLQPKKMKHRKWMRSSKGGIAHKGNKLSFGSFGLKAMEEKWITARQIEASRVAINRALKRKGKLWIRIFPDKPITVKGAETPMGGGKGSVDHYVFPITPGRIMFEVDGVDEVIAKEAFRKATSKLPIATKFIKKI